MNHLEKRQATKPGHTRKSNKTKGGEKVKISEYLRLERQKRCLTQLEMAKKLGVNRPTYATYENGWIDKNGVKRVPSPTVARRIAKLTGCSTEYVNQLIENERKDK